MGDGGVDEALECAFNCQDLGGAAKVWWTDTMQPAQVVDVVLQAAEVRGGDGDWV